MNAILKVLYDCIPSILDASIAWCGVCHTIKFTKENTDRTIKASEDASKKLLYATVKPIVCVVKYKFTDTFKDINCIFEAKIDKNIPSISKENNAPPSLIFTIKNTDNGIAIIKDISIKDTLYEANQLCIIEKGNSIDVGVQVVTTYTPSDITLHVSDIYDNIYDYHCTLSRKNDVAISCDFEHKSERDIHTSADQNISVGDISSNSGFLGNATSPITINNTNK